MSPTFVTICIKVMMERISWYKISNLATAETSPEIPTNTGPFALWKIDSLNGLISCIRQHPKTMQFCSLDPQNIHHENDYKVTNAGF